MHLSTLPQAIQKEKESLLSDAVGILQERGTRDLAVHDLAGYPEPEELVIPVLNTPMQPDIEGIREEDGCPTLGLVEVSTDLGDEACGRRWQAFADWVSRHQGQLVIFVHPEDEGRATEIALHWHVNPALIVAVPRTVH